MDIALGGMAAAGTDKKKLGIIAVLLVGLLVVLVLRFVGSSGEGTTDSARGGDALGDGGASLLDSHPSYLSTIAKIARLQAEKTYDPGASRDPMVPLVEERKETTPEPRTEQQVEVSDELPRMSLHGVIWDKESPIAIIDGLDLRVGDTIKGARVVEIGYDSVVLTYRSRRHVLTVN